jgi:DNA-binding FadR family transcriptional regulator
MEVYHLMQKLQVHFDRVRKLSLSIVPHESIIEDHERIVNCIRNQDIPQARAQLKTHLERYQIDASMIQTAYPQYFKPNPTQEG